MELNPLGVTRSKANAKSDCFDEAAQQEKQEPQK